LYEKNTNSTRKFPNKNNRRVTTESVYFLFSPGILKLDKRSGIKKKEILKYLKRLMLLRLNKPTRYRKILMEIRIIKRIAIKKYRLSSKSFCKKAKARAPNKRKIKG
jgi:hypothetical protein